MKASVTISAPFPNTDMKLHSLFPQNGAGCSLKTCRQVSLGLRVQILTDPIFYLASSTTAMRTQSLTVSSIISLFFSSSEFEKSPLNSVKIIAG